MNAKAQSVLSEPPLLIGQAKITASNGQFITLYNNSLDTIDMGTVQLAYYNSYDLTKATSSKFINLSGKLAPHNYYAVSDGALFVCYKMYVNAQTLGFSSTAGMVQVIKLNQVTPGSLVTTSLIDSLAWSKTATAGAQTLPAVTTDFLQRVWLDGIAKNPGAGAWQTVRPNGAEACDLQTQIAASATTPTETAPGVSFPVKAVVLAAETTPANNNGLVAPEITEILPNPAAPQADDTDEFIELYNPNDAPFSLKGYRLEAGSTYSRGYTFKEGILMPKSYTAFKITNTNLQLSNGDGQVRFLNPESTTISETPPYTDAPDGESWGVVNDSWQWSETPTPNNANKAEAREAGDKKSAKSTKTAKAKVAGASTTIPSVPEQLNDTAPLHPLVLAGVGIAAVGYALYEYRKDFANRFFQARRYFKNRRAVRARL